MKDWFSMLFCNEDNKIDAMDYILATIMIF